MGVCMYVRTYVCRVCMQGIPASTIVNTELSAMFMYFVPTANIGKYYAVFCTPQKSAMQMSLANALCSSTVHLSGNFKKDLSISVAH